MKFTLSIFFLLFFSLLGSDSFPQTQIQNSQLKANILLPDAQLGFYRGTRFDWSGMAFQITKGKNTYLQGLKLFKNKGATGTAGEFRDPLGYQISPEGEPFLKIGVGLLQSDHKKYSCTSNYKLLKAGDWKITKEHDSILFEQSMSSKTGFAYHYQKELKLQGNRLIIDYTLKNLRDKFTRLTILCR